MESLRLEHSAAVLFVHAVVVEAARRANVDVLVVKGLAADYHRLRKPTVSADVDVLCPPASLAAFESALSDFGWHPRSVSRLYAATANHAETWVHDAWPCDIDLHSRFPGIHAEPQRAFDILWRDRAETMALQTVVPIPSYDASALIMALHGIRSKGAEASRAAELAVVRRLLTADPALRRGIARLCVELEVSWPAVSGERAEPGRSTDSSAIASRQSWDRRVLGGGSPTAYGLDYMLTVPWRQRPRVLLALLWPTAEELRLNYPEVGPSRRAVHQARLARLLRGLRDLPRATVGALRARVRRR